MVSDGATGPVPGESHSLFGLVSVELESCLSETYWPIIHISPSLCPRSIKERIEKVVLDWTL